VAISAELYRLSAGISEAIEEVFQAGRYVYMEDLKTLATRKQKGGRAVPPQLQAIHTPLRCSSWQHYLRNHPASEFVAFLLDGISNGFNSERHQYRTAKRNMQSAIQNPEVVDKCLAKECEKEAHIVKYSKQKQCSQALSLAMA
jgi:hypothetical protein